MSRTTEAGNYPEETITTPGGYELNGTVWPDTGCTRWASHVPCRWAYSIAYFMYEQESYRPHPDATKSDLKGYVTRPRYVVYEKSRKKGEFKTMDQALAYIDGLRSDW